VEVHVSGRSALGLDACTHAGCVHLGADVGWPSSRSTPSVGGVSTVSTAVCHAAAMETPDYLAANQQEWTANAPRYAIAGRTLWGADPSWGIWGIPEEELGLLDGLEGKHVLEVGCGTAYVSSWMHRRGALPVGLDPTWAQLETARTLQAEHGTAFPLVCGIGEMLPFHAGSFDRVVSEYGSAIWSDPYRWIPEAARVLRPGGELTFLGNAPLLVLCADDDEDVPATDRLRRPLRGLHRVEWPDTDAVEFHLSHGDWIRLFRANRLAVVDLLELYPPKGSITSYGFVDAAWAVQWPSEEVWRVRKEH
jgi:SAM-dependent methyltransferase